MAEFTGRLGGPAPATAPIPDAVKQPDYLGTVARFGNAVGGLLDDRAKQQAAQKRAADEAMQDQALDTLAQRTFDIMSDPGMSRIVNSVQSTKDAVDAGAVSPVRLDMQLEQAIAQTMREFPDSKFEIFNKISELGVDHYIFRQARADQAQADAVMEAQASRTKLYLDTFTQSGLSPSLFPTEQDQLNQGRRIVFAQNELAQKKAEVEAATKEFDLTQKEDAAQFKLVSRSARTSYINAGATYAEPLFRNIIDLIETAPTDADLASFQEDASRILAEFDAFRLGQMNDARTLGLLDEDLTQIEKFYTDNRAAVQDVFSGELSVAKSKARALAIIKDSAEIEARNALPTLFTLQFAGITTALDDLIQVGMGGQLRDAALTEVNAYLNKETGDAALAGQKTVSILGEMRQEGKLPENATLEEITKAVRMDAPVHNKSTKKIAAGETTSIVELTEWLNQTGALSQYASALPSLEMSERDAAAIVQNFGSPATRTALMSARNVDDRRGVLAARMSAAAVLNGLNGLKQQAAEYNASDSRFSSSQNPYAFNAANRQIRWDSETGKFEGSVSSGTMPTAMNDLVNRMNMAVDHLMWVEEEVGVGFPEGLPFNTEADKINYLVNGVTPQNVIDYVNNQTPVVEKARATWGDARTQFSEDILAKAPPASQEGQFFGAIFDRIDAVENGNTKDYNTLFQFANTSDFADVKVSEMTLAQLDQFEETYGPWVQERNNGTLATPMGRFQIVGTTRRRVAKALDLPDSTPFTPDVQDAMAKFLIAEAFNNGTPLEKVWVGLANE